MHLRCMTANTTESIVLLVLFFFRIGTNAMYARFLYYFCVYTFAVFCAENSFNRTIWIDLEKGAQKSQRFIAKNIFFFSSLFIVSIQYSPLRWLLYIAQCAMYISNFFFYVSKNNQHIVIIIITILSHLILRWPCCIYFCFHLLCAG